MIVFETMPGNHSLVTLSPRGDGHLSNTLLESVSDSLVDTERPSKLTLNRAMEWPRDVGLFKFLLYTTFRPFDLALRPILLISK